MIYRTVLLWQAIIATTWLCVVGQKWDCQESTEKCQACMPITCPQDKRLYNSQEECQQDCPQKNPDCYICADKKCLGAFGLGCYSSPREMIFSGKTAQHECSMKCERNLDTGTTAPPAGPTSRATSNSVIGFFTLSMLIPFLVTGLEFLVRMKSSL